MAAGEDVHTDKVTNGAASEAARIYGLNTISRSKCFHHSVTNVIGFGGCIFKN